MMSRPEDVGSTGVPAGTATGDAPTGAGGCRDIVLVGGSAGGIEALSRLLAALPADLAAAVLVVVHMPAQGVDSLPQVLDRYGPLPTRRAIDGEPIKPGRVYVAARNHHLLVRDDTIRLSRSARQNRTRPAVDPLFRSAARWCGPRAVAVVLSGALDDGAAGLAAVRARGGLAAVQRPEDAIFPGMPRAALAAVGGDAVVGTVEELAAHIVDAVGRPVRHPAAPPSLDLIRETDMAEHDHPLGGEGIGRPVALGCPECNGGMSVIEDGHTVRYRCHVGHGYSPHTLLDAQREKSESGLWMAISFLEEQATVHRHLASVAPAGAAGSTGGDGLGTRDGRLAAADRAIRAAEVLREQLHDNLPE